MVEAYDSALPAHCRLDPIALASCLQVNACSPNALIQEQSLDIYYSETNNVLDYPASSVSVAFNEPGNVPFSPESAPVTASVDGQLVADWGMASDYAWADTVPSGVVRGTGDSELLTLISYGCTNLRVTEFPWVQ